MVERWKDRGRETNIQTERGREKKLALARRRERVKTHVDVLLFRKKGNRYWRRSTRFLFFCILARMTPAQYCNMETARARSCILFLLFYFFMSWNMSDGECLVLAPSLYLFWKLRRKKYENKLIRRAAYFLIFALSPPLRASRSFSKYRNLSLRNRYLNINPSFSIFFPKSSYLVRNTGRKSRFLLTVLSSGGWRMTRLGGERGDGGGEDEGVREGERRE